MPKAPRMYTEKQVLALKARLFSASTMERLQVRDEWYQKGIEEGKHQIREAFKLLFELEDKWNP